MENVFRVYLDTSLQLRCIYINNNIKCNVYALNISKLKSIESIPVLMAMARIEECIDLAG